jgi:hypothetical protein
MTDLHDSYGLDPSIVAYLQGAPSAGDDVPSLLGQPAAASVDPTSTAATPPLGDQSQPPAGAILSPKYPFPASLAFPQKPPYKGMTGSSTFGSGMIGQGETTRDEAPAATPAAVPSALHSSVLEAIQNGFLPPTTAAASTAVPQAVDLENPLAPNRTMPPEAHRTLDVATTPQEAAAVDQRLAQARARQAVYDQSTPGLFNRADTEARDIVAEQQRANDAQANADIAANNAKLAAADKGAGRRAEIDAADKAARAAQEAEIANKQQALDQKRLAAANYKVDTNRDVGWRGMLAIALSGIGDALDHRHGPNTAAQILDAGIDKRIEDQWRQKDELSKESESARQDLNDSIKKWDDKRQAIQMDRAVARDQMADDIERAGLASGNAQIQASAAAKAAMLRANANQITYAEAQRSQANDAAKRAAQVEAEKMALEQRKVTLDETKEAHENQIKRAELDEKIREANLAGDEKQVAKLKAINDNGFLVPQVVMGQDGKPALDAGGTPLIKHDWMRQENGEPYVAPEKAREGLATKFEGTKKAIAAIDSLRQLIADNGGDFNKWGSDARSKAQEYERALVGAHQAAGISGFRGNVMEVMDKSVSGGGDPTAILSKITPQLEQARKDLDDDVNSAFRITGNYSGPRIPFPDTVKAPKPERTQEENDLGELRKVAPAGMADVVLPAGSSPEDISRFAQSKAAGVTPSHKNILDLWGAQLANPATAPEAKHFLESIVNLPKTGKDSVPEGVREYARTLLGASLAGELKESR